MSEVSKQRTIMNMIDEIENAYNGGEMWVLGSIPQLIEALRAAGRLIKKHERFCEHEFLEEEGAYIKAITDLNEDSRLDSE